MAEMLGNVAIESLRADPRNPRKISDKAVKGLQRSIHEFGDLSGIVYNTRTDQLVSGHQRVQRLQELYGNLEIVDGAILTPTGETFRVRFVDWDEAKQRAANIAANSPTIQGEFTDDLVDILKEVYRENADIFGALSLDKLSYEDIAKAVANETATFNPEEAPMPEIVPEKNPVSQMTFLLSEEESVIVKKALTAIRERVKFDGEFDQRVHENANGHAVARLAEKYLDSIEGEKP